MSGIAGIFFRNRGPVDPEDLKSMGDVLAHRGPDGIVNYSSNHIGLVHCMLHDTPESLFEKLPSKTKDKRFVITWHGRIDNRDELKYKTGWKRPLDRTPDSSLILAAYDKWGSDCVYHLLGDFAFAIWDEPAQKLFCARDHMGVKPFHYILTDTLFAFASEIKGLLALSQCPRIINEERIADYLTCVITENEFTFYKNIFRLPPGHFLEVESARSRKSRYWQPHPAKLDCKNSAEYEEQFYEIFANAVRCRLRSHFPVGSFLSGGLDSSSIVCMAAGPQKKWLPGPLHTFSGIFDEIKQCDERKYFQSILDRYDVVPHYVYGDRIDPGKVFDHISSTEDEPVYGPHFFMSWKLMSLARKTGVRVMLDGHDGDSAVSHGYGLLYELLMQGRLRRLARECQAWGNSSSFKKTIRLFLFICKDSVLYKLASILPVAFQKNHFARMVGNLNPSFIQQTDIRERLLRAEAVRPKSGQTEYERHRRTITQTLHPMALESLERESIQNKLISRHPFFDINLIEFCLGLPAEQKFSHGYNRNIVRRSLRTILPENIIRRKTKTNFAPSVIHAFSTSGRYWLDVQVDSLFEEVYKYVSKDEFLNSYNLYISNPSGVLLRDHNLLIRGISLAQWLHNE